MKKLLTSFALVSISSSLLGCSAEVKKDGTPVLFNTKAEAEKVAKDLNCIGAHKMGDKWMPCENHKMHQKQHKQGGHHNH